MEIIKVWNQTREDEQLWAKFSPLFSQNVTKTKDSQEVVHMKTIFRGGLPLRTKDIRYKSKSHLAEEQISLFQDYFKIMKATVDSNLDYKSKEDPLFECTIFS